MYSVIGLYPVELLVSFSLLIEIGLDPLSGSNCHLERSLTKSVLRTFVPPLALPVIRFDVIVLSSFSISPFIHLEAGIHPPRCMPKKSRSVILSLPSTLLTCFFFSKASIKCSYSSVSKNGISFSMNCTAKRLSSSLLASRP